VGSLGIAPGGNIGRDCAVFEASHGAAPDIAGRGIANPAALILSGAFMLQHLGYMKEASRVENAVFEILSEGNVLTPDLGGKAKSQEFTNAICAKIKEYIK
jgi:isocitrate dehydrogenase (NAD+)